MALVRFSNLVNDIRGASGGNQFSRCAAGAMVSARHHKRKVKFKRNTNTALSMSSLAMAWRALSEDDRRAHEVFKRDKPVLNRLGISYSPSGFQVFCRNNWYRQLAGLAIAPTPGIGGLLYSANVTNADIIMAPYRFRVQINPPTMVVSYYLIFMSRPVPPGQGRPRNSKFKFARSLDAAGVFSLLVPESFYTSLFPGGTSRSGATVYGYMRQVIPGQYGAPIVASFSWLLP